MKKLAKAITVGALSLGLLAGVGANKGEAAALTKPTGSTFYKSSLVGTTYKVQDYKGNTINAKTTKAVTLTPYATNKNFSYATVTFVDYDKSGTKWVKHTKTAKGYFFTPIKNGITFNEYTNVKKGMTYNQMVSITGEYMKLESTYTYDGITEKDYTWSRYSDTTDTYVDMDFENNKLAYKSYYVSEY
ncbi:hypothetical protein ABE28_019685 [Peribacillus muralis]|uniref:Surface layer protein A domain-containing protein n=1 Tax=Peribacillus muralis TaxID=264697 RepID=A0A1B3XTQ2_9BACI|nr:hypothetical protein [Peribacillus muralis]AOH56595.1 hypothetical protein ABE28_019685 [Peribacillus muralis]